MRVDVQTDRVAEANEILASFALDTAASIKRSPLGRLMVCSKYGTMTARVAPNSGSLAGNYGHMGWGGTMAMAIGQLIRWVRNETRVPLHAWRYWASDTIKLCTEHTVALLEASTYPDPEKTSCVLCGSQDRCADWWNLDGVTGPCCRFGRCRDDKPPAGEGGG